MKRYHIKLKAIIVAMVLLIASSCDSWLDDNINPNALPTVPVNQMLPSALGSFGFHMGGSDLFRYSAIWSQQITAQAGRQTENYSLYVLADTELNGIWRGNLYAGVLTDLEEMLKLDPATTHPRYFGIAKVLKAFTYSMIVDFWGDVPFTEALQGVANVTPAVDDDAAIYPALITLLDQAIVDLKTSSSLAAPAGDDYVFNGNAARWIKTANVLKLRMYLKLANTPGFNTSAISSFITTTPAAEFMESNADDFQHPFATLAQRQNPTHQFILSRQDDICASSTMVNLMNGKSDPRRVNYFTPHPFSVAAYNTPPTGNTGYVGLTPGTAGGGITNALSRLHRFVRGAVTTGATAIPAGPNLTVLGATSLSYDGGASVNILTYSEYNFIRAELALKYGAPVAPRASVEAWYQEGIRASILDTSHPARPLVQADVDTYLLANGTLSGTTEDQLRKIIEEKYVANFMVTGEAWSDWRRTGYPLLQLLPGTLNPGNNNKVPRSLLYPQQEKDANPKIVQKPDFNVRVFWDTRTTGQE
jgi:hypothetical protein